MMRVAATVIVTALLAAAPPVLAQKINDRVSEGVVTIMTNGVTQSSGIDSVLIGDVAASLDEEGRIRVLPVAGYGAAANVRDMLYLRGIDAGITNADIFAYLRIDGTLPQAEKRLRLITKLFDKTVFLLARADLPDFATLQGRKIVAIGDRSENFVTARTVLALSKLDATLSAAPWAEAVAALREGRVEAVLAVEREAAAILRFVPEGSGLKLIGIPSNAALARIYSAKRVTLVEAPGLVPDEGVETLSVPTLLATFDWKRDAGRYVAVTKFIDKLVGAITRLKSEGSPALLALAEPDAEVAGWVRFQGAKPVIASTAAERARAPARPVTVASASAATATTTVASTPIARSIEPAGEPLRLAAVPMGPLADRSAAAGGLLPELLRTALGQGATITFAASGVEALRRVLDAKSAEIGFPFAATDCEAPDALSAEAAALCDRALLSAPIFEVLNVFFARLDNDFRFAADKDVIGRSVCVPKGADASDLDRSGRNWRRDQQVTVIEGDTLDACFDMLAKRDAEAVMADEFSGRAALRRLGLVRDIGILERPLSTTRLVAVAAKDNDQAAARIAAIEQAVSALKAGGGYSEIVVRHLAGLIEEPVGP